MKLSFVVPAWNEENYIRQCLAYLTREVAKCGHDIEIIVVNNASEDRTRQIAQEFQDIIVVDEPRKGLPQARQSGFLASRGDLIANIDADCLLPPGWIAKVYNQFALYDDLVALSGPYEYYDLSTLTNYSVMAYYLLACGLHLVLHQVLGIGAVLQGGNFVLRRTALEKIGRVKFLPALKMRTSGRRLRAEGIIRMATRYVINYFLVIFLKKPFTKKYVCIGNPRIKEE